MGPPQRYQYGEVLAFAGTDDHGKQTYSCIVHGCDRFGCVFKKMSAHTHAQRRHPELCLCGQLGAPSDDEEAPEGVGSVIPFDNPLQLMGSLSEDVCNRPPAPVGRQSITAHALHASMPRALHALQSPSTPVDTLQTVGVHHPISSGSAWRVQVGVPRAPQCICTVETWVGSCTPCSSETCWSVWPHRLPPAGVGPSTTARKSPCTHSVDVDQDEAGNPPPDEGMVHAATGPAARGCGGGGSSSTSSNSRGNSSSDGSRGHDNSSGRGEDGISDGSNGGNDSSSSSNDSLGGRGNEEGLARVAAGRRPSLVPTAQERLHQPVCASRWDGDSPPTLLEVLYGALRRLERGRQSEHEFQQQFSLNLQQGFSLGSVSTTNLVTKKKILGVDDWTSCSRHFCGNKQCAGYSWPPLDRSEWECHREDVCPVCRNGGALLKRVKAPEW